MSKKLRKQVNNQASNQINTQIVAENGQRLNEGRAQQPE